MYSFPLFDASKVDPRVRLAMRILELEQASVPTLADLAARVGLSSFHLSHLFSQQVGESYTSYSRRVRLEGSVNQIVHDRTDLNAVAATFGYASQTAYTRAFTRHFGVSPRRYAAMIAGAGPSLIADAHLKPIGGADSDRPLLTGQVSLADRPSSSAIARRFYGHDLTDHWQRFMSSIATSVVRRGHLAGLAYDNASVTPAARWRYDCALVLPRAEAVTLAASIAGMDLVEIPGGLHAELPVRGTMTDIWRATIGLFTEWLPNHPEVRPQGDPIAHWLRASPATGPIDAVATIRLWQIGDLPSYNMRPLDRHGALAGEHPIPDEA